MGLILDSSLLIASERRRFDLSGFLATRDDQIAVAAITVSELLHGCYRALDASQRKPRLAFVERVISEFEILPFALEAARHHARIWSNLAREGTMIGSHDLMIAATATSFGYSVATWNFGEFVRVPEIELVDEGTLAPFRAG